MTEVALKHYNSNPRIVRCTDNTIYHFEPKNQISMAMVKEEHVPQLLALMGGCCGNRRLLFTQASEADVARHQRK